MRSFVTGKTLAFLSVVALATSTGTAEAAWIQVAPYNQVSPDAIAAIEIATNGNMKEARIGVPNQQHVVRDKNSISEIEKLLTDSAAWMPGKGETVSGQIIKRYVRRKAILAVTFSCPSSSDCVAGVDGNDDSFSRITIDDATTVSELKKIVNTDFTLFAEPAGGFGSYYRTASIRGVRFVCTNQNNCTQADVFVPSAVTKITRDAKGISALLALSQ
jgi:hypothetical protein